MLPAADIEAIVVLRIWEFLGHEHHRRAHAALDQWGNAHRLEQRPLGSHGNTEYPDHATVASIALAGCGKLVGLNTPTHAT